MQNNNDQSLYTDLAGKALLENAIYNKGTAFVKTERDALGLNGLLPDRIETLEEQCNRAIDAFNDEPGDLLRHINLRALQDANETLFYALIQRHLKKLLPYIYTPVVGEACIRFSTIFRRPRGLFVSWPNRAHMKNMLDNVKKNPEVIVVTDGDRILGLGDLGMNGLGICIGKLSLYSAVGGFEPSSTLPVVLDVGTNNEDMLYGRNYLGWRNNRLADEKYFAFVEQFLLLVKDKWPHAIVQFEDFSADRAIKLLQKFRTKMCCFNDDIQGTASTVSAALLSAVNHTGKQLKDMKIAIVGAGTAGTGIADQLMRLLANEGLSADQIQEKIYMVDREGLLTDKKQLVREFQKPYMQDHRKTSHLQNDKGIVTLEKLILGVKPDVLIGVTGNQGIFNEKMIRFLAECHEKPIIFPLSNPGTKSEVHPRDIVSWSDGRALMATGSPFDSVAYKQKLYPVTQCNNIYIFPSLGLGVKIAKASSITDSMFDAAAYALASCSPKDDNCAQLLPFMESITESVEIVALAVAECAVKEGVADKNYTTDELKLKIKKHLWKPKYKQIKKHV